jgi:hypothetical protein
MAVAKRIGRAYAGLWTALAALCLCAGRAAAYSTAPPLVLDARGAPVGIVVTASPQEGDAAATLRNDVEAALRDGHRSLIVFQFRVYRKTRGPLALLGDHLERVVVLERLVRPEPIAGRYVLEESVNGVISRTTVADGAADLLDDFFTVSDLAIPLGGPPTEDDYVRAYYRLSPVRIAPQLALVGLLADLGERSSDWSVEGIGP